jgi:hypothetical protein
VADDGLKQEESEFNPDFIVRLLGKLDWDALRKTAAEASAPRHGKSQGGWDLAAVVAAHVGLAQLFTAAPLTRPPLRPQLGIAELPAEKPSKPEDDEGFLKSVHDLIMDVRRCSYLCVPEAVRHSFYAAPRSASAGRPSHLITPAALPLPLTLCPLPACRSTSPRAP